MIDESTLPDKPSNNEFNEHNTAPCFASQFKQLGSTYINLYSIDLNKVQQRQQVPEYTKMLAATLTNQQYISTGTWFGSLSDEAVNNLYDIAEQIETKDFKQYITDNQKQNYQQKLEGLVLVCMLLSLGSGVDRLQYQELAVAMESLQSIILTEYLHRTKKSVVLYRENYSLDPSKRMIAMSVKPKK